MDAFSHLVRSYAPLWPLHTLLLVFATYKLVVDVSERRGLARAGLRGVDRMDSATLAQYLVTLLVRLGYVVEPRCFEGGSAAALVGLRRGVRVAIVVRAQARRLGAAAVREAVDVRQACHCDLAIVVAGGHFTAEAWELARASHVQLWDRERLLKEALEAASAPGAEHYKASPTGSKHAA